MAGSYRYGKVGFGIFAAHGEIGEVAVGVAADQCAEQGNLAGEERNG